MSLVEQIDFFLLCSISGEDTLFPFVLPLICIERLLMIYVQGIK
jgi:hypothetical protein